MKRLGLLYILLFPFFAQAQQSNVHTTYLNKDSLAYTYSFDENWRFHTGDDSQFALQEFNDSSWEITGNSELRYSFDKKNRFTGICWMRLHVFADSSIAGRPLGLRMSHVGASEIYLDGKLIKKFGVISLNKDSCEYFDAQRTPFVFMFSVPGAHVFAVRYANYDAEKNNRTYAYTAAGFRLIAGEANRLITGNVENSGSYIFTVTLLFGIFVTLSLLHLLLFLYYRAEWSNLYFSIFCLAISLVFLSAYMLRYVSTPSLEMNAGAALFFSGVLACFSLSGFSNVLFSSSRIIFYIITTACAIVAAVWFFDPILAAYGVYFLVGAVSFEAVILTIYGIYKKRKGARIIGAGILFLTLFVLGIFISSLLNQGLEINDSTPLGEVLILLLGCAILSVPFSMSAYLAWNFSSVNKHLKEQLEQVKLLSEKALEQEQEKKRLLENRKEELEREVAARTAEVVQQHEELKAEKKKSDDLLLNILPEEVAEELKEKGSSEAKYYDHVSVLFTDFVAFTKAGERMTPQELVNELDSCFKAFDEIISRYGIEKIKTIGDAYLAVSGLPVADERHAQKMVNAALEIRDFMQQRKERVGDKTFEIRIGIHSGSVVAGIVGVKKFAYDIWGDTVNTAARMEQNSEAGKINISQTSYDMVKDKFNCRYRGQITAKNKGELNMYFVESKTEL